MGLTVKILWKIYKTPQILLHAARLKTWLTGVRPAVHSSWKALSYMIIDSNHATSILEMKRDKGDWAQLLFM